MHYNLQMLWPLSSPQLSVWQVQAPTTGSIFAIPEHCLDLHLEEETPNQETDTDPGPTIEEECTNTQNEHKSQEQQKSHCKQSAL